MPLYEYYCRDCNGVKPLFGSTEGESPDLGIDCLGAVPFDPELQRHCDLGTPLNDPNATPVGRALDRVADRLLDSLDKEPR